MEAIGWQKLIMARLAMNTPFSSKVIWLSVLIFFQSCKYIAFVNYCTKNQIK